MNSDFFTSWIKVLSVMFGLLITGVCQEADQTIGPRGYIRLLNAVAIGTGKLVFLIDGTVAREEGYMLGDVTGGIPRKPGSYTMKFQRDGVESGETKLLLVKDETVTLIPFAEYILATETKQAYWAIRILRLKQSEDKSKSTATIVNLTRNSEIKVQIQQPDESWDPIFVKRLNLGRTPILQRTGYVSMKTDTGDLKPLSVGTSGNFVAVLFEDADGVIRSQNFQDFKYLSLE